jgi:thiol-disulfide isomerase/thioredoxin
MVIVTGLLLSACGSVTPTPAVMMDKPSATPDTMMSQSSATPGAMMAAPSTTPEAMMGQASSTPDAMMAASSATPDAMMAVPSATPDAMMAAPSATPDAMMNISATPQAMMAAPGWYAVSLTDAGSGKTFSINDLKGKVVLVEMMAQWCSNCKLQQAQIKALGEKLGMSNDFVSISLDVDPNENAADLKKYVTSTGFDWIHAIAPKDVSREIANLYSNEFLNPTSTPVLIIDRQGIAHPLPFGIKSSNDLFKVVDQYLKAGM